jgi:hypothetical protein
MKDIYYLDDSPLEYKSFQKALNSKQYRILPHLENWQEETDIFRQYLENQNATHKTAVLQILKRHHIDLFMLDHRFDNIINAGTIIRKNILSTDPLYMDKKIIILSRYPNPVEVGRNIRYCEKRLGDNGIDYLKTAAELRNIIDSMLDIKDSMRTFLDEIS